MRNPLRCALAASVTSATLAWSAAPLTQEALPCKRLVQRERVDLNGSVVSGSHGDFAMYSGYVNVTAEDHLFYWLFEAQAEAPADAPVVIWSGGGPGCSSMEGAVTEHGPYILFGAVENPMAFRGKAAENPYAWNKIAHVLYVDQPRYVGFSCGTGPQVGSSKDAGLDMLAFLHGWRALFPEHAERRLILASQGYGGHFMPAAAQAIMDFNVGADAATRVPLIGLAIGNGYIDQAQQGDPQFVEFATHAGLVSPSDNFTTEAQCRTHMREETLGYEANLYDYRLGDVDCACGCKYYNHSAWTGWMNSAEVTTALHVCGDAGALAFGECGNGCIDQLGFDYEDIFDYLGTIGRALDAGIGVTLYYGMKDTAWNWVGGQATAIAIPWLGKETFANAVARDLAIESPGTGKPACGAQGRITSHGLLRSIQVEAAGHRVAADQGAAAMFVLETLMDIQPPPAPSPGPSPGPAPGPAPDGDDGGVPRAPIILVLVLLSGCACTCACVRKRREEKRRMAAALALPYGGNQLSGGMLPGGSSMQDSTDWAR